MLIFDHDICSFHLFTFLCSSFVLQVNLLKKMCELYSFNCLKLNISVVDIVSEIAVAWGDVGKSILFVLSSHQMDSGLKLCDHGFFLSILGEHSLVYRKGIFTFPTFFFLPCFVAYYVN